jgi:thymidylate synthase (FAD)
MFKTIHECGLDLVAHTFQTQDKAFEVDTDLLPVMAARASFGKQDKTGENPAGDLKLMKFLADEGHTSCFEHQSATFLLEVPLFIRSQIHRHRTFSYNEISRRYTAENLEFFIPDAFRGQSKSNKQCSDGVLTGYLRTEDVNGVDQTYETVWKNEHENQLEVYEELIEAGVARELARAVLPQSLLTRFYMTGNLRNWQHFIELRRDGHAQYEVQVVANRIAEELRNLWPESCKALGI